MAREGGRRGRSRSARSEVRRRAERLERDTGLPRVLAFQVAMGQLELSEALEKLALRDRVENLMRRYELPKSLATQVALGQADLDAVLARRRLRAYLDEHATDSIYDRAAGRGRPLVLALHGGEVLRGRVRANDRFELDLELDGGELRRQHKVPVRYAAWADAWSKVVARRTVDEAHAGPAEPRYHPKERFGCPDRWLFHAMEAGHTVAVTVLEGDRFRGTVAWFSRWEVGLRLAPGVQVVVFRHAFADVREA